MGELWVRFLTRTDFPIWFSSREVFDYLLLLSLEFDNLNMSEPKKKIADAACQSATTHYTDIAM